MIEEALLAYLREKLGPNVSYKEPPRALKGGFVNDVYSFELERGWPGRLVLRLFADDAEHSDVLRESCAQEVVAAQGVPAPKVFACEARMDVLGRAFLIMEFLPGRPQMIITFPRILLEVPRLFTLPRRHARAMNMVHSLDPAPLVEALGAHGIDATPRHWLDITERTIERYGFDGLRPGLEWLRVNTPDEPEHPSICHGDLFGANILERRGRITAILDWVAVTVADPAFDLGGQLAAYEMSATPGPFVWQWVSIAFGRLLAWGLRAAYRRHRKIPREAVRYYSAMRALTEMTFVLGLIAESRRTGIVRRMPTWKPAQCARYFRRRTGVRLEVPR